MPIVGADTHRTLSGVATGDSDILEKAIGLREQSRDASGLDGRTFALVKKGRTATPKRTVRRSARPKS